MTGKVKWFDQKKGFGFITNVDGSAVEMGVTSGSDVFVHYSEVELRNPNSALRTLNEGDLVEFTVRRDERGPRAEKVKVLTSAQDPGRNWRRGESVRHFHD